MIPSVDQALRDLLRDRLPAGTDVVLSASDVRPAVSLVLFGVRDDVRGRAASWDDVRDGAGALLGRRAPTRRYELSYVVSAHADDVAVEHELLSTALIVLTDGDHGLPMALRLGDALPSELGFPPTASFVLTATVAYVPPLDTELAAPAEQVNLSLANSVRPLAPTGAKRWARKQIEEHT